MSRIATRILGLDPGLNHTGWGVIESADNRLSFIACGAIHPPAKVEMSARLATIHDELKKIIEAHRPDEAAIEETFVNNNAASALKLGMARGVAMLVPALLHLSVAEYSANTVKKSVSGYGHADKSQIAHMIKILLPRAELTSPDATDALAIAITHAHHRNIRTLEVAS